MDFYECKPKPGTKLVIRSMKACQDISPPKPHTLLFFFIEDGLKLVRPVPVDMADAEAVLHALIEHGLLLPGDTVGTYGDEHVIQSSNGSPVLRVRLDHHPLTDEQCADLAACLSDEHWVGLSPR